MYQANEAWVGGIYKVCPVSAFTWTHFIYATYPCLIRLVHNLKCGFVLIEILFYLLSAWSQPSPTRLKTVSSRIDQKDASQDISMHTHLCVYVDIYILYILHKCIFEREFLFSFYHVYIYSYASCGYSFGPEKNQTIRCMLTWLKNLEQLQLASFCWSFRYMRLYVH